MLGVHSPFGLTNAANTAPLPWGDRLFMTWDVGRPVEIDPVTLGYLGEVGHRSEWLATELFPAPLLPMVTSTAASRDRPRPQRDVVREHALGRAARRALGRRGSMQSWPIAGAVIPQSVHTIDADPRVAHRRRLRVQGRAAGLLRAGAPPRVTGPFT